MKEEIKVGDKVRITEKSRKGVVTHVGSNRAYVLLSDGTFEIVPIESLSKTGERLWEVRNVLSLIDTSEEELLDSSRRNSLCY